MTDRIPPKITSFFTDKNGYVVIWQWPNIPIYGWIVFEVLSFVLSAGYLQTGSQQLSTAFLFTWAFLELTKGASYFRRALGFIVFLFVIVGFFKQ